MKKERSHWDPPRAGYGDGAGCAGSQLFIAAHYYRHCQPRPPVSLDPGVNGDHGGAGGAQVGPGGLCTRETMFPPSITLRSNNIPYINILQTTRSHLTREGESTFYIGYNVLLDSMNVLSELLLMTILWRVLDRRAYLMSFNWREINHHYLLLHDILRGEGRCSNYIGSLAGPVSPLPRFVSGAYSRT